jgi:hypothetical protein
MRTSMHLNVHGKSMSVGLRLEADSSDGASSLRLLLVADANRPRAGWLDASVMWPMPSAH